MYPQTVSRCMSAVNYGFVFDVSHCAETLKNGRLYQGAEYPVWPPTCVYIGQLSFMPNSIVRSTPFHEYLTRWGPGLLRLGAIMSFGGYCVSRPGLLRLGAVVG